VHARAAGAIVRLCAGGVAGCAGRDVFRRLRSIGRRSAGRRACATGCRGGGTSARRGRRAGRGSGASRGCAGCDARSGSSGARGGRRVFMTLLQIVGSQLFPALSCAFIQSGVEEITLGSRAVSTQQSLLSISCILGSLSVEEVCLVEGRLRRRAVGEASGRCSTGRNSAGGLAAGGRLWTRRQRQAVVEGFECCVRSRFRSVVCCLGSICLGPQIL